MKIEVMEFFYRGIKPSRNQLYGLKPRIGDVYYIAEEDTFCVCYDGIQFTEVNTITDILVTREVKTRFGNSNFDVIVMKRDVGPFRRRCAYAGKIEFGKISDDTYEHQCKFIYIGTEFMLPHDSYYVIETNNNHSVIMQDEIRMFDFFLQEWVYLLYDKETNTMFNVENLYIRYDVFGCREHNLVPNLIPNKSLDMDSNHAPVYHTKSFWECWFGMPQKLPKKWILNFEFIKKPGEILYDYLQKAWTFVVSVEDNHYHLSNGDVCNEFGMSMKLHPEYKIPLYLLQQTNVYKMYEILRSQFICNDVRFLTATESEIRSYSYYELLQDGLYKNFKYVQLN